MPFQSAADLNLISESQLGKAATANGLLAAMSSAALYGIKSLSGLSLTLYGGNIIIAGEPTPIASQTLALTAASVNYIYSTSVGVFTKTTSIPGSWPGPLASDAVALYELDVGASSVNEADSINYVPSIGVQGDAGTVGAQGPAGTDLANTRKRMWSATGSSSVVATTLGFDTATLTGATATARTIGSGSLRESIPYLGYVSGGTAGSSAQVHSARTFCYLGNAAGRGGFTLSIRFCLESASSPATARSFFGLFVPGTIGNVEPDSQVNIIGVGALASDANFSIMHNDASGTATKVALGANFPARATDTVYEFTLTSVANSGAVTYSLTNVDTGNVATGTISTNLPANTVFQSWVAWVNNGSTASVIAMGLMQIVGETRY